MEKINLAVDKVQETKERFVIIEHPPLDVIRKPEHLEIMAKAARAGTVLLSNKKNMLPLGGDDTRGISLIEFASHLETGTLKIGGETQFATKLRVLIPGISSEWLDPSEPSEKSVARVRSLASSSDVLIVATRNAHLMPRQREPAQEFLGAGGRSVLLCLRNPYDAGVLTGAESVLCTCGDSEPSLSAAAEALVGAFVPNAELPVPLRME